MPEWNADFQAIVIALVLVGIMLFFRKKLKKKISPIKLIMISAVMGILLYGF